MGVNSYVLTFRLVAKFHISICSLQYSMSINTVEADPHWPRSHFITENWKSETQKVEDADGSYLR